MRKRMAFPVLLGKNWNCRFLPKVITETVGFYQRLPFCKPNVQEFHSDARNKICVIAPLYVRLRTEAHPANCQG